MFEVLLAKLLMLKPYAPKVAAIFTVLSGPLLFGPKIFLEKLGLASITESSRPVIGFLFLLSVSILVLEVSGIFSSSFGRWRKKVTFRKNKLHYLRNLSGDEK